MGKGSWIRGQYYFGESEMTSSLADAETDTEALLPHPKENTRRPKFWKSFFGIKDKFLDVALAKTEESSFSEDEYILNPRRRRRRLLFWRRTHMLLKEVPSMDSSLSSFSNFHSKGYLPTPSLEYHNVALTVSQKSVSSINSKVYYRKGSIPQFSPRLGRGDQGSATQIAKLSRRREELWLLLAPVPRALQSASPNGPATALVSGSPPDVTRWKWQPLDLKKPEVGPSKPLLGVDTLVSADPFSSLRIDHLKSHTNMTNLPSSDSKVQALQVYPKWSPFEVADQAYSSPKRANSASPLSRQSSQPVLDETTASGDNTSDNWSPHQSLLKCPPSHALVSPLMPLLPENWSPNWAALGAPVLSSPAMPNVAMARSEPQRYHRTPVKRLSNAVPSPVLQAPQIDVTACAPCRVDIDRSEMDPNCQNQYGCVEEISPYTFYGALPIQDTSSNSVNGSERGILTERLAKLFSFPAKHISSSVVSADSVEGRVSLDSLSASCSDSHDHASIAVARVTSYRYLQHLNFLHAIVAKEGNEAKLLKYLN
jgi:hypothetical protein